MTLVFILLALAVVALVAGVVTGRIGGGMDEPVPATPHRPLPETRIEGPHLADLRFTPVLRGYRMSEVDDALDRVAVELGERDLEIARLRARLATLGVTDAPEDPAGAFGESPDVASREGLSPEGATVDGEGAGSADAQGEDGATRPAPASPPDGVRASGAAGSDARRG